MSVLMLQLEEHAGAFRLVGIIWRLDKEKVTLCVVQHEAYQIASRHRDLQGKRQRYNEWKLSGCSTQSRSDIWYIEFTEISI